MEQGINFQQAVRIAPPHIIGAMKEILRFQRNVLLQKMVRSLIFGIEFV